MSVQLPEFETIVNQPENADKRFELLDGEMVEVPSNPYVSVIANLISFYIQLFLQNNSIGGHVTDPVGEST